MRPKRLNVGSLMLVVVIFALIAALYTQHERAKQREARLWAEFGYRSEMNGREVRKTIDELHKAYINDLGLNQAWSEVRIA